MTTTWGPRTTTVWLEYVWVHSTIVPHVKHMMAVAVPLNPVIVSYSTVAKRHALLGISINLEIHVRCVVTKNSTFKVSNLRDIDWQLSLNIPLDLIRPCWVSWRTLTNSVRTLFPGLRYWRFCLAFNWQLAYLFNQFKEKCSSSFGIQLLFF